MTFLGCPGNCVLVYPDHPGQSTDVHPSPTPMSLYPCTPRIPRPSWTIHGRPSTTNPVSEYPCTPRIPRPSTGPLDYPEFMLKSKSQSLLYDFTTFTDKLWGQRLLLPKCCQLIHSPFLTWTVFPIWILACFQGRPEAACPWLGVSMYQTASSDSACSCCTPSHGGAGKEIQRCAFSHFHTFQGSFSSACSVLRNVQCPFHHTHTHFRCNRSFCSHFCL